MDYVGVRVRSAGVRDRVQPQRVERIEGGLLEPERHEAVGRGVLRAGAPPHVLVDGIAEEVGRVEAQYGVRCRRRSRGVRGAADEPSSGAVADRPGVAVGAALEHEAPRAPRHDDHVPGIVVIDAVGSSPRPGDLCPGVGVVGPVAVLRDCPARRDEERAEQPHRATRSSRRVVGAVDESHYLISM